MSASNQAKNAKLEKVFIFRDENDGTEMSEIYLDSSNEADPAADNDPQKLQPFQHNQEAQCEPFSVSAFENADTVELASSDKESTRIDDGFSLDALSDSAVDDVLSSLTATSQNKPHRLSSVEPKSSLGRRTSPVQTYRNPTELLKCPCCPYTAMRTSYLREHQKMHSSTKCFQCEKCEFRTRHLGVLTRHMRVHMGLKPYECTEPDCDKSYSSRTALQCHQKTHQGTVKFFYCSICPYKTKYKYSLKPHERKHTGERPYICAFCGKSFIQPGHLRKHQIYHSENKPIKCPKCPKSFACNSDLKNHERTHYDERPYACSDCNCHFKHLTTLINHKKTKKHLKKNPASSDKD